MLLSLFYGWFFVVFILFVNCILVWLNVGFDSVICVRLVLCVFLD